MTHSVVFTVVQIFSLSSCMCVLYRMLMYSIVGCVLRAVFLQGSKETSILASTASQRKLRETTASVLNLLILLDGIKK